MSKKVWLFVCVVVLTTSSAASAGVLSWLFGFPWTQSTSNSQQQALYGTMGQVGIQVGSGSSSDTNHGSYGNTQTGTTPSGGSMTQSTHVNGTQSTFISGGTGSFGVTYQSATVRTYQGQWAY